MMMKKKEGSIRSLGKLLATPFTKNEVDFRPLAPPSVAAPSKNRDDDDDDLQNTSDPLIGRTIDADLTIEDEVRSLLGLAPAVSANAVKPPIVTERGPITRHACSDSNLDQKEMVDAADPSNNKSRRTELRKSKSGDGTGSRYVRCKYSSGRQRSMRKLNAGSSTDNVSNNDPVQKPEEASDALQVDHRRTLTKTRKSSTRRMMVSSDPDEKLGDNIESEPTKQSSDGRMPVGHGESMRSKGNESTKSSSKSSEQLWATSHGKSCRDRDSCRESKEQTTDVAAPRRLSLRDRRRSYRRMSMRDKRQSSRRVSETSSRPLSSRQLSTDDKKHSSRRLSGVQKTPLGKSLEPADDNCANIIVGGNGDSELTFGSSNGAFNNERSFLSKSDSEEDLFGHPDELSGLQSLSHQPLKDESREKETTSLLKPSPRDSRPRADRQPVKKSSSHNSSRRRRGKDRKEKRSTQRDGVRRGRGQSSSANRRDEGDAFSSSDENGSFADEHYDNSDSNKSKHGETIVQTSDSNIKSQPYGSNTASTKDQIRSTRIIHNDTLAQINNDKTKDSQLSESDAPRSSNYLEFKKRSSIRQNARDPCWDITKVAAEIVLQHSSERQPSENDTSAKLESETKKTLSPNSTTKKIEEEVVAVFWEDKAYNDAGMGSIETQTDQKDYLHDLESCIDKAGEFVHVAEKVVPVSADNIAEAVESLAFTQSIDLSEADNTLSSFESGMHFVVDDPGSVKQLSELVTVDKIRCDNSCEHRSMNDVASLGVEEAEAQSSEVFEFTEKKETERSIHNDATCFSTFVKSKDEDTRGGSIDLASNCKETEVGEKSAASMPPRNIENKMAGDSIRSLSYNSSTHEKPRTPRDGFEDLLTKTGKETTQPIVVGDNSWEGGERLKHFRLANHAKGLKGDKRKRRLSDSMFWKSESALKVESEAVATKTEKELSGTGSHCHGESQYARRRSEGAAFIQNSINDLLLSPISTNSLQAEQNHFARKALNKELKEDRWAAISPMRAINNMGDIVISNELLLTPSPQNTGTWDLSPQKMVNERHAAPSRPPRQAEVVGNSPSSRGSMQAMGPKQGNEGGCAVSSLLSQTISTSGIRLRRRSTSAIKEVADCAPRDVKELKATKQRLRGDRWAPISSMKLNIFPIIPESQRRKSLGAIHGVFRTSEIDLQHEDDAEQRFQHIKQELREDRWAPISPMRPIVASIDNALVPDISLYDQPRRWAASACSELKITEDDVIATKVMQRKRSGDCRSESEISFDHSLLNDCGQEEADDVDDELARSIAQQVAQEHASHENFIIAAASIQSRQYSSDPNPSSPVSCQNHNKSSGAVARNEDECARMIARKTALEHLIGDHMATVDKLRKELEQIESRIDALSMNE